ncbi:hypothetical protein ACN28C_04430 [Plantactinospora sp. WMMC1484]|uniref:hypothetical protein n=1 Tax=Plantactinospora sp. WMMC1484 TaxID=3404122 RepID=UPI003BF4ADC9
MSPPEPGTPESVTAEPTTPESVTADSVTADESPSTPERDERDLDLGGLADHGAATPDDGRDRADRKHVDDVTKRVAAVTNIFYGGVDANRAVFGVQDGIERRAGGHRKVTGRLAAEEIDAVVHRYAEPPCFDEALKKLQHNHVVVIEGQPGAGRRAGGINLLRRVTGGALIVLSPTLSLRELAERTYSAGYGYLVLDHVQERQRADLEFTWSSVKERIHESGAHLVITTSTVGVIATGSVPHIAWEQPDSELVLRAQLSDCDDTDAVVHDVMATLGDDRSLNNLVAMARMIRDEHLSSAEALKKLDESVGRRVLEWFAGRPGHRDIIATAALCFLEGTDVRTYETLLERLHEVVADRVTDGRAKAEIRKEDADIFGERESRLHGTGLLEVRTVPWLGATIQIIAFKDEGYRRHVLAELWRTQTIHFWDAIREWLTEAIGQDEESHTAVASGLAWLACSSVNEVLRCYVEPWGAGSEEWPGQVTATYVLWYMCHREGLQSIALHTAVAWSRSQDAHRKWTAVVAFGGELGVFFPSEAVNRLWQLMSQNTNLWPAGCAAIASLFATLSDDDDGDPATVLNLLDKKMTDFGTGAGPKDRRGPVPTAQLMRLRNLTMAAALAVVAARSIRSDRPAVMEYLDTNPERLRVIARIWAGVIRFRPLRWEALYALRQGLHALRDISSEPTVRARDFGTALAESLPPVERHMFHNAFMQVDEQARKGRKEPLAEVLVACLDAIARKIHFGGTL